MTMAKKMAEVVRRRQAQLTEALHQHAFSIDGVAYRAMGEFNGPVCVDVAGLRFAATPGWDGAVDLPIEITTEDGEVIETAEPPLPLTGDRATDLAAWVAAITPFIRKYR